MTRRNATVRELVEELAAQAEALERVPAHRRDRISLQHHRRDVLRLARLLEKRTRPAPAPTPKLPGERTVARAVLERLEADRRGKDHAEVRMLTGLTDAELCVRIIANPSTVRPRRVDLTKAGLVEAFATENGATRWTISELGRELLEQAVRRAG